MIEFQIPSLTDKAQTFDCQLVKLNWDDEISDILIARAKNTEQTREAYIEYYDLVDQLRDGRKVSIIYFSDSNVKFDSSLKSLVQQRSEQAFDKVAFITNSRVLSLVANLVMRFKKVAVETRIYATEEEAKNWLRKKR